MTILSPSIDIDFKMRAEFLNSPSAENTAGLIDHTLLKPDIHESQIQKLVLDGVNFKFRSICLPPYYVKLASEILKGLKQERRDLQYLPSICTVIGFPLGYSTAANKCNEIKEAQQHGATEFDFVQNISLVKSSQWENIKNEFVLIKNHATNNIVKIILETSLLTKDEIYRCSLLASQCGIDYIKTSTGFSDKGAQLEDIHIIASAIQDFCKQNGKKTIGIKASGGIKNFESLKTFVQAGATRIGTSSGLDFIK